MISCFNENIDFGVIMYVYHAKYMAIFLFTIMNVEPKVE